MGRTRNILKQRCFKKGHQFHSKRSAINTPVTTVTANNRGWIPRLTPEEYSKVVKKTPTCQVDTPGAEGQSGSSKILRPKGRQQQFHRGHQLPENKDKNSEMRLLHQGKYILMWNECIQLHAQYSVDCRIPQFEINKEEKWGLCWRQSLSCKHCGYTSPLYKLYQEIPSHSRGRKAAAPNYGLQVGLQESTIGNTKARWLLACTNTPPPQR